MTSNEQSILHVLKALDAAAKITPEDGPRPSMLPLFARLDELTRRLPPETAPDLMHFLHHKSYEKARLWLEGRNAENERGECPKA